MDPDSYTKPPSLRRWTAIILGGLFLSACGLYYVARPSVSPFHSRLYKDQLQANEVAMAVEAYQAESLRLPPAPTAVIDTTTPEGIAFLNILLGKAEDAEGKSANLNGIQFLVVREGKARKGGLDYGKNGKVTGLFDSRGHAYRIYIDTTGKGSITLPSGRTITGHPALAVSNGSDGKQDTADDLISGEPFPPPGPLKRFWRSLPF